VVKQISLVSYELDLSFESKIYPIFDVSLLKPSPSLSSQLVPLSSDDHMLPLLPEEVLDVEFNQLWDGNKVVRCLIKWKELEINEVSWEGRDCWKDFLTFFHK